MSQQTRQNEDPHHTGSGLTGSHTAGGKLTFPQWLLNLSVWYQTLAGVALTRPGMYYALILSVVAAVAVIRQINIMLILAGMLLGPIVYNFRLATAVGRALKIRRVLPSGVCAGDLVVVRLEVKNTSTRRAVCAVRVTDQVLRVCPGRASEEGRPSVVVAFLAPGESTTVSYEGRLARRGLYRFGPLTVTTQFPFGLVERKIVLPLWDELVVCPRLGRLSGRWGFEQREPRETVPHRDSRESRRGDEFFGVRDWQRGDSLRKIHWRSSARHGKWVVRQFELPRNQDVALLVDLVRYQTEDISDGQVEYLISFAATVLSHFVRERGNNIFFGVAAKKNVWVYGPASPSLLRISLEHLAVVEPGQHELFSDLWSTYQGVARPGTRSLIITWRPSQLVQLVRSAPTNSRGGRGMVMPYIVQVPGAEVDEIFSLGH